MNIFRQKYLLRTYSKQEIVKGYAVKGTYHDKIVMLNVQPTVQADLKNLPEGERAGHSIKSYGDFPVQTADAKQGYRADRLRYDGEWYKCVASFYYEHTPLKHWKSLYVRVSEADTDDEGFVCEECIYK